MTNNPDQEYAKAVIEKMRVVPASRMDCQKFILSIHYARRWPSVTFRYALEISGEICGVVTFGSPPSAPLLKGLAGHEYSNQILELNRLCLLNNKKNEASFLVANAIKQLPKNRIIISYADPSEGHIGYVYQACNFYYCGLSAKRTNWQIKGQEHKHARTIAGNNTALLMREKHGDNFYLADRQRKHRYLFFHGSKSWRRKAIKAVRYPFLPFPKASNKDYEVSNDQ